MLYNIHMKFSKKTIIPITILLVLALAFIVAIFPYSSLKKEKNLGSIKMESPDKLILGFSQIGSESAWRTRNTQSIFEAAENYNIQILFDDAQQKQENQLKAIRSFIVYQVDVIAFVPIVEDGWDNVLQEAKDAGIPVIIVDRQINADKSLYAGFLGEDGVQEGKKAAEFLVNKTKDISTPLNIIEISGTEHSSVATDRSKGFRDVISKHPKFKIIYSADGDFLRSRGKEIMTSILKENNGMQFKGEPIDVIYSHNDSMTLGMLDSLEENAISTENTIILSIDGEQKSIDALKAGKLNCVVECNPNLGPTLMKLVLEIHSGKMIPRYTYMTEQVFTEYDNFNFYGPRGY